VLKDVDQKFVEQGIAKARSLWQGRVDAGKLEAEELERKLRLIAGTTDYDGFGDVDFVIEAVPERIEVKQSVFSELDEVTPGHAILASNTSSLSITEMGEATGRPEKVVGFHFFYPASVMRLIEVVEGEDTSPDTAQAASNFAQAIRKLPIRLWRGAGLRGQPDPELERVGAVVRDRRRAGSRSRSSTSSSPSPRPLRSVRSIWLTCSASTPSFTSPSTCATATATASTYTGGCQRLVQAGDLGAKTGKGFYEHGS